MAVFHVFVMGLVRECGSTAPSAPFKADTYFTELPAMSQSVLAPSIITPRQQAFLYVLGAVLLWGVAPIGNRYFLGSDQLSVPCMPYMALRFSISSLCFLPAVVMAARRWSWRDWMRGAACGFAGVGGYNMLGGIAGHTVSAGLTGLLNSTESLIILILACFLAKRLPDRRSVVATLIGAAGIVLLAWSAGPAEGSLSGILLLLLAALGWALYCVWIPPLIAKHGAVQSSAVTMMLGTLPLLALGAHGLPAFVRQMGATEWEILLALALGSSVIALLAWNKAVAQLGAQTAGWFLYLMPVLSALGGRMLLAEPLTIYELIGGVMILSSVYIAQR